MRSQNENRLARTSLLLAALWVLVPSFTFGQALDTETDSMDAWRARLHERLDQTLARLNTLTPEPQETLVVKRSAIEESPDPFGALPQFSTRRRKAGWSPVAAILSQYGLPPQLLSVVEVESGFNPSALSPKGARGLWQLMPETARRYGLVVEPGRDERLDPLKSTSAAARYLKDLYGRFQDWPLALAAYNAGEGRVQQSLARLAARDFWTLRRSAALPEETLRYVPAVLTQAGAPLTAPLFTPREEAHFRPPQPWTSFSEPRVVYARTFPAL